MSETTSARRWIGLTKAGRILETTGIITLKVLQEHQATFRQLPAGKTYKGRIQFLESEVQKIAKKLNKS